MPTIQTPLGEIEIEQPKTSPLKLSRLYGFRFAANGAIEQVPSEAAVIRYVIETVAASSQPLSTLVPLLLVHLAEAGIRNRSGKRFIQKTLLGSIRPIFGGRVWQDGEYLPSQHYPAIVPWDVVWKAMQRIKNYGS